jgi:hypothetical protein
MRNPFDRPEKFPERGDEDVMSTYAAIGIALTKWEIAENAFAHLFGTLVSPTKLSFPAERAYGSVQSARGRKDLILSAAEVFFRNFPEQESDKELKKLMADYDRAGARRNEFAHGIVAAHVWQGRHDFTGYYLGPSFWNTNKRGVHLEPVYIYNTDQINSFSEKFGALTSRAFELQRKIRDHFLAAPEEPRKRH